MAGWSPTHSPACKDPERFRPPIHSVTLLPLCTYPPDVLLLHLALEGCFLFSQQRGTSWGLNNPVSCSVSQMLQHMLHGEIWTPAWEGAPPPSLYFSVYSPSALEDSYDCSLYLEDTVLLQISNSSQFFSYLNHCVSSVSQLDPD